MPNIALAAAFCLQLLMLEFIPHWLDASGASQVVVIAYVGAAKAITDLATRAIEWRPGCSDQSSDTLARWTCWLSAVALLQAPGLDVPRPAAPFGQLSPHAGLAAVHGPQRCALASRRPSRAQVLWIAAGTFLARGCICKWMWGARRAPTSTTTLAPHCLKTSEYEKTVGNTAFLAVYPPAGAIASGETVCKAGDQLLALVLLT